jgi:UPF0755 protein
MVTFPEGITVNRFSAILKKNLGVDSLEFITLANSDSLLNAWNIGAPSFEGFLKPDTYEFYWQQPAIDILRFLVQQQNKLWQEKFASRALQQGKSRLEILTLASIVEAETPRPEERARIAGVYHNRLEKGMKLEADPTVQYSIGETRRLRYKDLEYKDIYNTYVHTGLPPGPINSPSASSIEAALNPEENSYYFFCAKGDGSNTHSFATSASEHAVNVLQYRRNRKSAD